MLEGVRPNNVSILRETALNLSARTIIFLFPWIFFALATLVYRFGPELPAWIEYLPFLVSVVVLGLPHGAVDHFIPFWTLRKTITRHAMTLLLIPYLGLIALYLSAWYVQPELSFLFFVGMTWYHWGQGDLQTVLTLGGGRHLRSRGQRMFTLIVRGGLPMLVPLLAFPEIYRSVAVDIVGLFAPEGIHSIEWFFGTQFQGIATITFLGTIGILFIWTYATQESGRRQSWWLDLGETLLLLLFFSSVPPLLAGGLYFCFWHAARHIVRLQELQIDMRRFLHRGQSWTAWFYFLRAAAPTTLAALILFALFYFAVPFTPRNAGGLLGLYLAGIAALTLPHTVLVTWLDRRQGIWESGNQKSVSRSW